MERNRLSLKCPSALEKTRRTAASDPEIIYSYYDMLEDAQLKFKIQDRPECIWNIDETSLFLDPRKTKVIAPKGEKATRTQATSGREATTVMAGISAAGDRLPPLLIFKGKKLQSTWRPVNPYKDMQFACSETGWMVTDIFNDWFNFFCTYVTQRPLLLVYDGHSTHINSTVIRKAISEDIRIIKLPPHTTDRLQPLDVVCFKPLKTRWDKEIATWMKDNSARRVNKSEFASLVGNVWDDVFNVEVIKTAFQKTGLYPCDRNVYPKHVFAPHLMRIYSKLKVVEDASDATPKPATPRKNPPATSSTPSALPLTDSSQSPAASPASPQPSGSATASAPSPNTSSAALSTTLTPATPSRAHLTPRTSTPTPSTSTQTPATTPCDKSFMRFEHIMAERATISKRTTPVDGTDEVQSRPVKRRAIDSKSRVLTEETYLQEIVALENQRKMKEEKKEENKKKKALKALSPATSVRHKKNKPCAKKQVPAKARTQQPSPEDAVDSSSESDISIDDVSFESTSTEFTLEPLQPCTVAFSNQAYQRMQPKLNEYYAVGYSKAAYIVRLTSLADSEGNFTAQYMDRLPENKYQWKKTPPTETIHLDNFFSGPLKLTGIMPYTILGLDSAFQDFKKYLKAQGSNIN
jgi:hypothetical protein